MTPEERQQLDNVIRDARTLAGTLLEASNMGLSNALILPQLVLVFREVFGEMPDGFALPGMGT